MAARKTVTPPNVVVENTDFPDSCKSQAMRRCRRDARRDQGLVLIWHLHRSGAARGGADCGGKGPRRAKTCMGTAFCRFGTQDLTVLGITLDKMPKGFRASAKVKPGVSGCPRNHGEPT